jgi:AI-2 transport protein TqsA
MNLTTATRYGLNVLALLGASIALHLGKPIFVPLTIAAVLAAILWQPAEYLKKVFRMPWFFACISAIGTLVFICLLILTLLALSSLQFVSELPRSDDEAKQRKIYQDIRTQLPFLQGALPENPNDSKVFKEFQAALKEEGSVRDTVGVWANYLFEGMLILFVLLFLLLEGRMLGNKVRNIFGPGPEVQAQVSGAFKEMAEAVRTYLVWRTIVNFSLALVLAVVYYFLGLQQWMLWALLTAILCYVPYLGTIIAGIPPVLDALVFGNSAGIAFGILLFYATIVTLEGYIVVPWVMGRSMDLNATTVLLACLYWSVVWGPAAGFFLAMPLMAAVKAVCLHVDAWKAWGELMSSEEEPPEPAHIELVPAGSADADDRTVVVQALPDLK